MLGQSVVALGLAVVTLAGCASSSSSSSGGGGKLTATGCQSQMFIGDQMKIRAKWTAAAKGKYTVFWLDGADNFTVNNIFDETLSTAQSNDISGEYDLPGPTSAGQTKTIVALITANKAGNNTINISVWSSNGFDSGPPDNAASLSCSVAINP
jgi:hypothetical protein